MGPPTGRARSLVWVLVAPLLLVPLLVGAGSVGTTETAPVVFIQPRAHPHLNGHVDTPTSELFVAETLTSARWSTGATKERYLGRPFWVEPLAGDGVRVAVIDTGIDPDHPDLRGSVVAWRDFLQGRAEPYDDDTHGTHVAGIIGARGHLQARPDRHYFPFGAQGVAPGVSFIVAKAMDRNGDGDAYNVAQAIRWALDPNGDGDYSDGAHIINLSIGLEMVPRDDDEAVSAPVTLPGFSTRTAPEAQAVEKSIQHAVRSGAIVVVAAGNHEPGSDRSTVTFPGTMPEVITVGALDSDGQIAAFSNIGTPGSGKPDLVAPGVLLSTFPLDVPLQGREHHGYVALGGTSMAAPMVSGTIALMLEGDPTLARLSASEDLSWHTTTVRNALIESADGSGHDPARGYGTLRVDAAVRLVDQGEGGIAWGNLATLSLLVLLVVGVVLLRRRRKRVRAALRRAKAEARARVDAETRHEDERRPHPTEVVRAQAGPIPKRPLSRRSTIAAVPREPTRSGPPVLSDTRPPPGQRPPWERR